MAARASLEEVDENLILTHGTSKSAKGAGGRSRKEIVADLKLAPMVMEGLGHLRKHLGEVPKTGPMAIYHGTGRPWEASRFRRKWREIARACKIPDTVQNRDSRAGAITEARDLGADMEKVRDAATHSNIATTERYSRMRAKKATVIEVQKIRLAARNKPQTGNH